MNCEEFVVPPLRIALPMVKETLRCIIQTVLFSRSIGGDVPVDPVLVRSDILGLTYCRCSAEYNSKVETRIREFSQRIESTQHRSLVLVLSFFTPRHSRKSLWDILSQPFDDKAVFEKWKFQIDLDMQDHSKDTETTELRAIQSAASQARQCVFNILRRINDRMDHLPVPPNDQMSYYFDISFDSSTAGTKKESTNLQCTPNRIPALWSPQSIAQSIRSIPFIT
jgi:hypothetical protein